MLVLCNWVEDNEMNKTELSWTESKTKEINRTELSLTKLKSTDEINRTELNWVELNQRQKKRWTELSWVELNWRRDLMNKTDFRWTELSWVKLNWRLEMWWTKLSWTESKTKEINKTELRLTKLKTIDLMNKTELRWTKLSWPELNWRLDKRWDEQNCLVELNHCQWRVLHDLMLLFLTDVTRPPDLLACGCIGSGKKNNSSNLSFFLIWLFLAMASHGGLHWYIFWQWSFEEDWGSGDTQALACVCVLIKAVWPQNALSMFVCVHVLIRAVCSKCALVFSVLWLNNRSDVIQEQMRGGKNRVSWMRGEKNR